VNFSGLVDVIPPYILVFDSFNSSGLARLLIVLDRFTNLQL
jgi:hypothetical protein